jgi:hypothetical protein
MSEGEKLEFIPKVDLGSGEGGNNPPSSIFSYVMESVQESKDAFAKLAKSKEELKIAKAHYKQTVAKLKETKTVTRTIRHIPVVLHIEVLHIIPAEKLGVDAELKNLGWKKVGLDYYGILKAKHIIYECCLRRRGRGDYDILINNPPIEALVGSHGLCFALVMENWYSVHFNGYDNPVIKIAKLEQYLREVIN